MKKIKNKKTLSIILLVLIIVFGVYFLKNKEEKTQTLTQKTATPQKLINKEKKHLNWLEFQEKAKEENVVVIDIRTKEETNQGTLLDAKTDFDFYQADFENKIKQLDPEKEYLIYCRSGRRSGNAIPLFEKYNLKVQDLAGGKNSVR